MAREFQLFARGEDTKARQSFIFCGLLNEDSFRKIHLARDGQHGVIGEAIAVSNDRERIAFEARGGENVKGVVAAFHGDCHRREQTAGQSDALELLDGPFVNDITCIRGGFAPDPL
jgi:hypothetical protein